MPQDDQDTDVTYAPVKLAPGRRIPSWRQQYRRDDREQHVPASLCERIYEPNGIEWFFEAAGASHLDDGDLLASVAYASFGRAEELGWPRLWIAQISLTAIAPDGKVTTFTSPFDWAPAAALRPPGVIEAALECPPLPAGDATDSPAAEPHAQP